MFTINKNKKSDLYTYSNLFFCLFPLSFIIGNLATNVNILLFCIFGFLQLKKNSFTFKLETTIKVIFFLFFIIFFSTSVSFFKSLFLNASEDENLVRLIKSIFFFRFFLLLVIIYFLNNLKLLNLENFFISLTLASLFVSFDVIFQYIFSFNLIGMESYGHHNTGFFGDEYIAGGFIQNFSFFSIFYIAYKFKNKKNLRFITVNLATLFLGAGILLSGNRMPLILFVIGLLISIFLNKKLRKVLFSSLILFLIFFKFMFSYDNHIAVQYKSVYSNVSIINNVLKNFIETKQKNLGNDFKIEKNNEFKNEKIKYFPLYPESIFFINPSPHVRLFLTAIDTWKKNVLLGNGIKSFRFDCHNLSGAEYSLQEDVFKFKKNRLCSNHPHNYYLEILTETGIIGLSIILTLLTLFIFFIIKSRKNFNGENLGNYILLASTISLFLEFFPIKTSGSIFTTSNATYIILVVSILLSYIKKFKFN
jgi:O-antigen ligase